MMQITFVAFKINNIHPAWQKLKVRHRAGTNKTALVLTLKHETSWKITTKSITGNFICVITH